jgi:protease I
MSHSGKKVAVVLANNYEDVEYTSPAEALKGAGAELTIIGTEKGEIKGKKGDTQQADKTFDEVSAEEFDMLLIPGGGSPENLRIDDGAVRFTKDFAASGKPIGAICHGAQLLISADAVRGKKLTAVNKIRDDVRNAGGAYEDSELVTDGNLITSRVPDDLPVFNKALVEALAPAGVK